MVATLEGTVTDPRSWTPPPSARRPTLRRRPSAGASVAPVRRWVSTAARRRPRHAPLGPVRHVRHAV